MKTASEASELNPFYFFDSSQTTEQIHSGIRKLCNALLTSILNGYIENEDVSPDILPELLDSEPECHNNCLFYLWEICRLLIKSGNRASLMLCINLSHQIYKLERRQNTSRIISYLHKGIAQISLGMTDIGVKNVLSGISENPHLRPSDLCLSYRALMSAAIVHKNIGLALKFAAEWKEAAKHGNLPGELFRSCMSIQILHLVSGNTGICGEYIRDLSENIPEQWKEAYALIGNWTNSLISGICYETRFVSEPCPLFAGLDWQNPDARSDDLSRDDFATLCEMRRRFCTDESVIRTMSVEKLEKYASFIAGWELPKALSQIELILKQKTSEKYYLHIMNRFLGKYMMQEVMGKTPDDPDIVINKNAIILSADIRNYSLLSEYGGPDDVVDFDVLNPLFKMMNQKLGEAGGTVLEFVGDRIVVVFNTFRNQQSDISDILFKIVDCLRSIRIFTALFHRTGLPEIRIGVGINKGTVAIGYIGGLVRCNFTVLGQGINIAARIEDKTKELPGIILTSASCFDGKEPGIWQNPLNVSYMLRDLGVHAMKNIRKPVHLYSVSPLLRYWVDFVPMGFVASPEKGVVYLDTGNSSEPGIIDHHFQGNTANSACELLLQKPELLLGHLQNIPQSEIEFRVHIKPDLDCAATFYAACELLDQNPRTDILKKLADYISCLDYINCSDREKIPMIESISDSLHGVATAHTIITEKKKGKKLTDIEIFEAQVRVIDAAVYLMEKNRVSGDFGYIFRFEPTWFESERHLIRDDVKRYYEDVRYGHSYQAHVTGTEEVVTGLWLNHPKSIFFKIWAWSDPKAPGGNGYKFLSLNMSEPGKKRFVISVDPASGNTLNGLGVFLEKYESEKRKRIGKKRPIHPIRHPADNSDPWYFGQGHSYMVVDSPGEGTVLTAKEVRCIHQKWKSEKG